MSSFVWFRQSTHHHVRVSDCLHLITQLSRVLVGDTQSIKEQKHCLVPLVTALLKCVSKYAVQVYTTPDSEVWYLRHAIKLRSHALHCRLLPATGR